MSSDAAPRPDGIGLSGSSACAFEYRMRSFTRHARQPARAFLQSSEVWGGKGSEANATVHLSDAMVCWQVFTDCFED